MAKTDNLAGRLYEILDATRKVRSPDLTDNTARCRYAKVFGLSNGNTVEIVHRLFQIHRLFDEVLLIMRSISDFDEELYLNPLSNLRFAVPLHNIETEWGKCAPHLSDAHMTALAFVAHELSRRPSEGSVNSEDLNQLLTEIDELYKDVMESSLDPDLKLLILERLEAIRQAIHEYRIRGIKRLREELAASIGTLIVNEDLIKQSGNKEEVQRFGKIINNLATYVSLASNVMKIAETVIKYFPT